MCVAMVAQKQLLGGGAGLQSSENKKQNNLKSVPSQQGKLPTEKMFPENYLEIGNGLPTRKTSVWELFGSVTGIKSVII